jgi:hypothetical protein
MAERQRAKGGQAQRSTNKLCTQSVLLLTGSEMAASELGAGDMTGAHTAKKNPPTNHQQPIKQRQPRGCAPQTPSPHSHTSNQLYLHAHTASQGSYFLPRWSRNGPVSTTRGSAQTLGAPSRCARLLHCVPGTIVRISSCESIFRDGRPKRSGSRALGHSHTDTHAPETRPTFSSLCPRLAGRTCRKSLLFDHWSKWPCGSRRSQRPHRG